MSALKYWLWLSRACGSHTARRLLEHFSDPMAVFFAEKGDYRKVSDVKERDLAGLESKSLGWAASVASACAEKGVRILTLSDAAYPERLRNIFDPPVVLYVKGDLPDLDSEAAIAVAGTRRCTPYGVRTAERMGFELGQAGCTVVSGLARGIDTAAARGALRAGGKVIGVLGCGTDVVYPRENGRLYDDVALNGALVTEYAPGEPPAANHFPARNRIFSGLAVGVVIIEAPEGSGALITASRALEQGRDVFAVPGNVDSPACRGSNALLKEGAIAATSGRDVAEMYAHLFPDRIFRKSGRRAVFTSLAASAEPEQEAEAITPPGEPEAERAAEKTIDRPDGEGYIDLVKMTENMQEDEKRVVLAINTGRLHADEIVRLTGMSATDVMTALTMLEIEGTVSQLPGKYFTLSL